MLGEKKNLINTTYYAITTDWNSTEKTSPGYLGKLRSNLFRNEFNVFGAGENPNAKVPLESIRLQHA